jgi:hypothetical protein
MYMYSHVFRGLGKAVEEQFAIVVRPDFDISKRECPPRHRSEAERNIEAEVRKMADLGVLEPSNAPTSTNFVFVPKRTNVVSGECENRTATNYRRINSFTKADNYPLPTSHKSWRSTGFTLRSTCGPWDSLCLLAY